jgi:hypothetical protein
MFSIPHLWWISVGRGNRQQQAAAHCLCDLGEILAKFLRNSCVRSTAVAPANPHLIAVILPPLQVAGSLWIVGSNIDIVYW